LNTIATAVDSTVWGQCPPMSEIVGAGRTNRVETKGIYQCMPGRQEIAMYQYATLKLLLA